MDGRSLPSLALIPINFFMRKIFLIAGAVSLMALPLFASAQTTQGLKGATGILQQIGGTNGEKLGVNADLAGSAATVIKTVLALMGTIFLVLTIYAGILWMTAQGEEARVTKAKDILKEAVIGLAIVMSAYAFTFFITSKLTTATGAPNQNSTQTGCCFASDYSVCAPNYLQSQCNTSGNTLWQAGACPTGHPPGCP